MVIGPVRSAETCGPPGATERGCLGAYAGLGEHHHDRAVASTAARSVVLSLPIP